eukprot:ctg_5110.g523
MPEQFEGGAEERQERAAAWQAVDELYWKLAAELGLSEEELYAREMPPMQLLNTRMKKLMRAFLRERRRQQHKRRRTELAEERARQREEYYNARLQQREAAERERVARFEAHAQRWPKTEKHAFARVLSQIGGMRRRGEHARTRPRRATAGGDGVAQSADGWARSRDRPGGGGRRAAASASVCAARGAAAAQTDRLCGGGDERGALAALLRQAVGGAGAHVAFHPGARGARAAQAGCVRAHGGDGDPAAARPDALVVVGGRGARRGAAARHRATRVRRGGDRHRPAAAVPGGVCAGGVAGETPRSPR